MDDVDGLRDALHLLRSATDLDESLDDLLNGLRRASPSSLGLEVHALVAGQDVRFGRFLPGVRPGDVTASLRVPLLRAPEPPGPVTGDVQVTFYAGRAGAFVDLAADLAHAQGLDPDRLELDGHAPSSTGTGVRGLERVSVVHRAVGVLIAQGHDAHEAYDHLVAQARTRGVPLADHAQALVDAAVQAARETDAAH